MQHLRTFKKNCHIFAILNIFVLILTFCIIMVYRARRSEARIQQMLWKVNYSDIVFINTVCV